MKLFRCECCGQVLHFENTQCLGCGAAVGYDPERRQMVAVERRDGHFVELGDAHAGQKRAFCRNWENHACNWLIPPDATRTDHSEAFCLACQHNRTVPDLSDPNNLLRWQKIEMAKRRLIYSLLAMGLPLPAADQDHPQPLVFDFKAQGEKGPDQVMTGHAHGVITIALSEADDSTREALREQMGEAYRTLLGHFRHEIGHYYWDLLLRDTPLVEKYRDLFGDERADYGAALERHYQTGAPANWPENFVSSYATMHPWEDWAECFAHYLHMIDTIETAYALGLTLDPKADREGHLTAAADINPYRTPDFQTLIEVWTPLSVAVNTLNRSMGQPDFYPFSLPAPVQAKLAFVHDVIVSGSSQPPASAA